MNKFDVTVGRSNDNDIQIDDPTVSGTHAILTVHDSNFHLVDDDSTNGTFVDSRRVKSVVLNDSTNVIFGSYRITTQELIDRCLIIVNKKKVDFSSEYVSILHTFKQYQSRKNKIQSQSTGPLIFRLITSGIIVLVILMFPDLISNNIRYPLIILVGLLPLLYNYFFNSRTKKQEQVALLDLEYEERLRCPKCGFRMIGYNYTYWQGRSKCLNNKCNAIFQS